MSGYKIVLPGNFTNAELPMLRDDPILNKGSLLLVEPGHPAAPYLGNISDGDVLPNLAWKEAQEMTKASYDDLQGRIARSGGGASWRTSKGGIQWRTGGVTAGLFPIAVMQYLRANPNHVYRMTWWGGMAVGAAVGVSGRWSVVHFDAAQATSSIYFDVVGSGPGDVDVNGEVLPGSNTKMGFRRHSAAGLSSKGPITATALQAQAWSRMFGYGVGTNHGPGGGQALFHRIYMEDLTVSGRSAEQVNALDRDLYIKHALKPGGRYYGEAFVDK